MRFESKYEFPLTDKIFFAVGVVVPMPRILFASSQTNPVVPPNAPPLLYWICVSDPPGEVDPPVPAHCPEGISKHPDVNLIPFANVEVAVDVLINEPPEIVNPLDDDNPAADMPPAKVEVAVVVA